MESKWGCGNAFKEASKDLLEATNWDLPQFLSCFYKLLSNSFMSPFQFILRSFPISFHDSYQVLPSNFHFSFFLRSLFSHSLLHWVPSLVPNQWLFVAISEFEYIFHCLYVDLKKNFIDLFFIWEIPWSLPLHVYNACNYPFVGIPRFPRNFIIIQLFFCVSCLLKCKSRRRSYI